MAKRNCCRITGRSESQSHPQEELDSDGVGQLKVGELTRYKSAHEIRIMTLLKKALDPQCMLNPGKVLLSY